MCGWVDGWMLKPLLNNEHIFCSKLDLRWSEQGSERIPGGSQGDSQTTTRDEICYDGANVKAGS